MYNFEIIPSLQKDLNKIYRKDKKVYEAVMNKIDEILLNPQHYKPLKYDFAGERRVHIMKNFVLKFEINESTKTVKFIFFGHHDEAYKR
jgi:YafQ family addiction module toxin component